MMGRLIGGSILAAAVLVGGSAHAACDRFAGSTMQYGSGPVANWRTDYPEAVDAIDRPWTRIDFISNPADYMRAVLRAAQTDFVRKDKRLVRNDVHHEWWISPWMDYTSNGRERSMGLTKERGPDAKDLSPTSQDSYQVWAVGFYNRPGALVFGSIFEDECDPQFPKVVQFPENTVSVKFLFTDASPEEVTYLKDAPEYEAFIDVGEERSPKKRQLKSLRLLQVDISVKDSRARDTDWVFGTFVWRGPPKGDELFDNLEPASLQWGNDPGVYDQTLRQSWINGDLRGILYGWAERPFLGFNGRANGPADNLRSSCLSCHSTSRAPAGTLRQVGRFDMVRDYGSPDKVKQHVDAWFKNYRSKDLFLSDQPAAVSLDYSLQLESAIFRICNACLTGGLTGPTPKICRDIGYAFLDIRNPPLRMLKATCEGTSNTSSVDAVISSEAAPSLERQTIMEPPRQ
ncbi:hypothetical protein IB238_05155 [Rhizobium sp. ARZ01]|uniref:hypothetical protein n=1 Tax=Rhizobium sp. ARZ01 TaxID=2769313 RepID=UPI00177F9ED2|nr:hypothetical protein [Rhizobium sp. ARZ01]MBD9372024.1 hypothetical protein [Rhizobium sp. ARZ01]